MSKIEGKNNAIFKNSQQIKQQAKEKDKKKKSQKVLNASMKQFKCYLDSLKQSTSPHKTNLSLYGYGSVRSNNSSVNNKTKFKQKRSQSL